MRTKIVIDDELIEQAMKATGLPTKTAVVEAGLQLLIQVKAQRGYAACAARSNGWTI